MSTAVKMSEAPSTSKPRSLVFDCVLGVGYIVACLAILFHGLPHVWWQVLHLPQDAKNTALLLVASVAFLVGAFFVGRRLAGENPPEGWSAGIFTLFVGLLSSVVASVWIGTLAQTWFKDLSPSVGLGLMGGTFAALVIFLMRFASSPRFERAMATFDGQGWFSRTPFKKNQGLRVRRATLAAVLLVVGCGIFTIESHRTLYRYPSWDLLIPFTDGLRIMLLPHLKFTVPLILAVGALWFGYRLVNVPVFADFLIATEAELNKVSWTTRKRLVQDTIVVLVTVFLMTVFLFFVDQIWAFTLSKIGVVQLPDKTQEVQKDKEATW